MIIQRLFINYASITAKAIIERYEETKKVMSMGDKYFEARSLRVKGVFTESQFREFFTESRLRESFMEENKKYDRLTLFLKANLEQSNIEPIRLNEDALFHLGTITLKPLRLWIYQDAIYGISGTYSDDEEKLLILEYSDKERKKFEQLQRKFANKDAEEIKYERLRIPEEVRIAVWRRDQGRCASCGSRENLEYDHIVPVSKGGSTTTRNIELLCQNCNRSKGNRIE